MQAMQAELQALRAQVELQAVQLSSQAGWQEAAERSTTSPTPRAEGDAGAHRPEGLGSPEGVLRPGRTSSSGHRRRRRSTQA